MNGSELGRESGVDGPNAAQLNLIDQSLTPFLARPMNKQVTAEGPDPHFRETLAPLYKFPIVLPPRTLPQPLRAAATAARLASSPVAEMVRRFSSCSHSPSAKELYLLWILFALG